MSVKSANSVISFSIVHNRLSFSPTLVVKPYSAMTGIIRGSGVSGAITGYVIPVGSSLFRVGNLHLALKC
jgi:hypothetical protein